MYLSCDKYVPILCFFEVKMCCHVSDIYAVFVNDVENMFAY